MNNQNEEKKTVVEIHTMNAEEQERLETSIKGLPEREQQILTLRYGLNGEEKKTQKEVAEILGLSIPSIVRIERKAINHVKMIRDGNALNNRVKEDLEELGKSKKAR